MSKKLKTKKGVASFYIVAFSTLILVVVATSFAAVIISEIERTTNDDLAQSAYDSALAGVEDAKLAVYAYQNCVGDESEECETIRELVEKEDWESQEEHCSQVANILGRGDGEVAIQEMTGSNSLEQYYTCVTISGITNDYKTTLTDSSPSRVIKPSFDTDGKETGVSTSADDISQIRISWYSSANKNANSGNLSYKNFVNGSVVFSSVGGESDTTETPTPPIISVGLVQTASSFKMSDFDKTSGSATDRGLIYLVPTDGVATAKSDGSSNFISAGENNLIDKSAFLSSNNKSKSNKPYTVACKEDNDYVCSATIELPDVVNGERSDDTFAIVVSLPYGRPDVDIKVEFLCGDDICGYNEIDEFGRGVEGTETNIAKLEWTQIEVDSTGRANDLYRRVETRLENDNSSLVSGMNVIEVFGDISKDIYSTCEYDFNATCLK